MKEEMKEIEAGDNMIDYRRLTREERVKLLKQTHNDNIEEMLQRCIEAAKEVFNERIVTPNGDEIDDYRVLRRAWISVALKRCLHISTHDDQEIIDLLLDEEPSDFNSYENQDPRVIVTIKNGLRGSFIVDNVENQILVTDIPSGVKAIKFFDAAYKQKIRDEFHVVPIKYECWHVAEEDDYPY